MPITFQVDPSRPLAVSPLFSWTVQTSPRGIRCLKQSTTRYHLTINADMSSKRIALVLN